MDYAIMRWSRETLGKLLKPWLVFVFFQFGTA